MKLKKEICIYIKTHTMTFNGIWEFDVEIHWSLFVSRRSFCDYKNLSSWGFVVFSKHIPQSKWRKESSNGLQELLVLPWTNFGFIVNSECAYVLQMDIVNTHINPHCGNQCNDLVQWRNKVLSNDMKIETLNLKLALWEIVSIKTTLPFN